VTAQATVPFVPCCAAQQLDNYSDALWLTATGSGDIDTNCAMVVGGDRCQLHRKRWDSYRVDSPTRATTGMGI
jgi:hypothetical protein